MFIKIISLRANRYSPYKYSVIEVSCSVKFECDTETFFFLNMMDKGTE